MFNSTIAKTQFIDAFNKIEFGNLGIRADGTGLMLRASAIELAGELFTNLIQGMAADADASVSTGRIDDRDALAISDACRDLAAQIIAAAERVTEAA